MLKTGGAWTVCRFKGGLGKKEGGDVFEGGEGGGSYPNAHYDEFVKSAGSNHSKNSKKDFEKLSPNIRNTSIAGSFFAKCWRL